MVVVVVVVVVDDDRLIGVKLVSTRALFGV